MKRTQEQCRALQARVVEELTAKPRGMKQLGVDMGVGYRTLEKHMDALRLRGLIDYYGIRPNFKWASKEYADAQNARRKADQEARSQEADERKARAKARRLRQEQALDAEIEREAHVGGTEWQVVQRVIPAGSVRAQITGPRSVWDLAA